MKKNATLGLLAALICSAGWGAAGCAHARENTFDLEPETDRLLREDDLQGWRSGQSSPEFRVGEYDETFIEKEVPPPPQPLPQPTPPPQAAPSRPEGFSQGGSGNRVEVYPEWDWRVPRSPSHSLTEERDCALLMRHNQAVVVCKDPQADTRYF